MDIGDNDLIKNLGKSISEDYLKVSLKETKFLGVFGLIEIGLEHLLVTIRTKTLQLELLFQIKLNNERLLHLEEKLKLEKKKSEEEEQKFETDINIREKNREEKVVDLDQKIAILNQKIIDLKKETIVSENRANCLEQELNSLIKNQQYQLFKQLQELEGGLKECKKISKRNAIRDKITFVCKYFLVIVYVLCLYVSIILQILIIFVDGGPFIQVLHKHYFGEFEPPGGRGGCKIFRNT